MDPAAAYLKRAIEETAEFEGWELLESATESEGGAGERSQVWVGVYRLPLPDEEVMTDELFDSDHLLPEETRGPPLIFEVESNYVTIQSPISLRIDFVKARIKEVFDIIGRYGFGLEIDEEALGDEVDLFLTYRIYATGYNTDVMSDVLDALAPCAYELLDLEERFNNDQRT